MKRLGAALMLSALTAARAAAQVSAPMPPPVPTFPLKVHTPPQYAPKVADPATEPPAATFGEPVYDTMQSPMPPIRIPQSYYAPYAQPIPTTCNTYPGSCGQGSATCGFPGGCSQNGCGGCGVCGPMGRFWGEFDYLLWSARGDRVPPLVTTSPTGTPAAAAGVLATPGVAVLAGASGLADSFRSGVRYNVGGWFNEAQTFGIQFGGFFLADQTDTGGFASTGDPILSRPFTNALTGAQASQLVALPGVLAGGVAFEHTNSIMGLDAALRGNMCCGSCFRLDALLGYRYIRMEEGLSVAENLTAGPLAPGALGVPVGTNIHVLDSFTTTNNFHGIQAGITGEYRFWNRVYVSGTGKASFGWIDQITDIAGATSVAVPGLAPVQNTGGLLALSSNIGHYNRTEAVIVPEVNMNLGYQVTDNVRLRAGYNFLYVSSVARPGNVIDTNVNPALIPPPVGNPIPSRPIIQQRLDDFFLHGISAGLEVRF